MKIQIIPDGKLTEYLGNIFKIYKMENRKPKLASKISAVFITGFIITVLASPFIALGVGIGYLIWK